MKVTIDLIDDPQFWISGSGSYLFDLNCGLSDVLKMNAKTVLRRILSDKYDVLQKQNPRFSRRAFAKKLGLSPGAMSEILSGRRRVSVKVAEKISTTLSLDPQESSELLAFYHKDSSTEASPSQYHLLPQDQFAMIADWYHFGILSLMKTRGFVSDARWIAERLGLSGSVVSDALNRLKRLSILSENPQGEFVRSKSAYRTSDDIQDQSVHSAHRQYLTRALESLEKDDVSARDFSSVMLVFSPEDLKKAKEMIRKFQDNFCEAFEGTDKPEVYQLTMQLFSLSKKVESHS